MKRALDIVIVDDKVMITDLFKSYIELLGYSINIETFNDSNCALEYLKSDPHIDIIITDYKMPGRHGLELLEVTKDDTMRVLVSGFITSIAQEKIERLNVCAFEKPIPMKQIRSLIENRINELDLLDAS